ncbi:MAG: BrnT family toxin [Gemmatimonadales bacterium]
MAADIDDRLAHCTGFDWDDGNVPKLQARHQVTPGECEQVFFHEPLLIVSDPGHSRSEERWAAWGRTVEGRLLAIIFTLRADRIRPLSARDMNRKERRRYAEAKD